MERVISCLYNIESYNFSEKKIWNNSTFKWCRDI